MTHERLAEIVEAHTEDVLSNIKSLILKKNAAYSSVMDALNNFKEGAEEIAVTPYQVWAIYFKKQTSAILKAIADDPQHPQDLSEGLYSRLQDSIAYILLFNALLNDPELNKEIQ